MMGGVGAIWDVPVGTIVQIMVSFTDGATDGAKAHAWRSNTRLCGFGEAGVVLIGICGSFTLKALATRGNYRLDRGKRKFVVFFIGAGVRSVD